MWPHMPLIVNIMQRDSSNHYYIEADCYKNVVWGIPYIIFTIIVKCDPSWRPNQHGRVIMNIMHGTETTIILEPKTCVICSSLISHIHYVQNNRHMWPVADYCIILVLKVLSDESIFTSFFLNNIESQRTLYMRTTLVGWEMSGHVWLQADFFTTPIPPSPSRPLSPH